ncbi:thioredoxin-disulfide reductase [Clostridium sediminicola]|uniref:thioredoxin-disulfide reductase n=1 Tax=Clostridium sediminicola TaxID=3114879 RepID=UPI0031F26D1F
MENLYDVVILGAGPAGLAAGLYAARARMKTLILEKDSPGGQIVITHEIANYPGAMPEESGPSLVARMVDQTEQFGAERISDNIVEVQLEGKIKVIKCEKGEYRAKSVIIATGAEPKLIGCPGEKEFTGKGVSYCATCDADFFAGLEVFVVGGGDSAVEEALYLTKFARKVTIVHRRDQLRAAKSIQEKAFRNDKMNFMWNAVIEEIKGDGIVESVVFKNTVTGETNEYFADEDDGIFGVFVFIGYTPISSLYEGQIEMEHGYIVTDQDMKTNIEGVFAAGDIRVKSLRQVITAAGDGAIAAVNAERYVEDSE